MKVAIDVSVVGLAQLYETAKTGIYRAISSLSEELLRIQSGSELKNISDIAFTALSSLEVNSLTEIYYKKRELGHTAMERSIWENFLFQIGPYLPGHGALSVPARVLSRLYRTSVQNHIEKEMDIFHSMYSALPRFSVSSHSSVLRMLTIYDIIPLLYPHYFADGFAEEFKPIVSSFAKEKDFIFAISECTKKDVCDYFGIVPERVIVTPLAASPHLYYPDYDLDKIREIKRKCKIPDAPYFLTLATVEKRKNLVSSIASFKKFINEEGNEDIHFVLVGTRGWKVHDVFATIENDAQLRERVHFTGFLPDAYLSAIYSGALAFMYPSLYEGFGLPPLEAMQCGVPVICSATSSLPEVVGDAGILIDPQDTDAIADAMIKLAHDTSLRQELIKKGIQRAATFSWKRCAEQTLAGYSYAWDLR